MNEIVERCVDAILAKAPLGYGFSRYKARDFVVEVMKAMREPTEAMLEAVVPFPAHLRQEHAEDSQWHIQMTAATIADRMAFRGQWQDAIDAALTSEKAV